MSKFANRLTADDKAVKAEQVTLAEANAKASVQQEVAGLTAKQAMLKSAYNAAFTATPFSVKRVFQITAEIKQNEEELAIATKVLNEEFAD